MDLDSTARASHASATTRTVTATTDRYVSAPDHRPTMSLRVAVAAPFRREGRTELQESKFKVKLSLDWDWFSPDQAGRLADVAVAEGLLLRDGDRLVAQFDPMAVEVPEGFVPDESILQERSTFDRVLAALGREGIEKQTAVANLNRLKSDMDVTTQAAAVLYAHSEGVDVADLADRAREEL